MTILIFPTFKYIKIFFTETFGDTKLQKIILDLKLCPHPLFHS